MAHPDALKRRAATLSLGYNVVLTFAKVIAAAVTGSMSLLSEAVHSATDVVASGIAFASIRMAAQPPDEEHPYGHGKVESLAGFGESVLLMCIVAYIVFEAVQRLLHPTPVANLNLGLVVMAVSSVSALAVGAYVGAVGRRTGSLALVGNGQHLLVDCWTSVGVLAALALTRFAGWARADAWVALGLAAWIARGAWQMSRRAFHELIDHRVSDEEMTTIHDILAAETRILGYHRLRTRHSGSVHYVDLHVVVPREWSVVEAHELADALEDRIERALAPAHAVIHIDPFDPARVDPSSSARPGP